MSAFLQILYEWVSQAKVTQMRDLFENTSSLRDLERRTTLVNSFVGSDFQTTLLLTACKNGHYDVLTFLVDRCGANVNLCGDVKIGEAVIEGVPPLWLVSHRNDIKMTSFLISRGADVNAVTKKSCSTPLRAACHGGYFELVKLLVSSGANIELGNFLNSTCLMLACARGFYDIVQYFLENKAQINRTNFDGQTCLHDAAENGNPRMIKLLIDYGAVRKANNAGVTPVLVAAMYEKDEAVKLLSKGLPKYKAANALELLGAKKVCSGREKGKKPSKSTPVYIRDALECWREAVSLRQNLLQRNGKHSPDIKPRAVYNNLIEFQNHRELAAIQRDPKAIRFTALLICERILGLEHPFTFNSIRDVAVYFGKAHEHAICFRLCLHTVDIHMLKADPFDAETFHIFRCCVNLFFAFKIDEHSNLLQECHLILADLFSRIMAQLDRLGKYSTANDVSDFENQLINGYYSLAIHMLALLSEVKSFGQLRPHVDRLAKIPLANGAKVFLALSTMSKCEGTWVVDWNTVDNISKSHIADVSACAYKIASQLLTPITISVLSNCENQQIIPNNALNMPETENQKTPISRQQISWKHFENVNEISKGEFGRVLTAQRVQDHMQIILREISLNRMNAIQQRNTTANYLNLVSCRSHRHLLQLYNVYEESNKLILELEYCTSGSMLALISKYRKERNYFPETAIQNWLLQLASALKFLHDNDIIHRNIRAANVFFVDNGINLKLGHMGTIQTVERYCQRMSLLLKTPRIAPEVLDHRPYTKKSDVWALGALTFHIAALRKMYEDDDGGKHGRARFPNSMPYGETLRNFVTVLINPSSEDRPVINKVLKNEFLLI